MPELGKPSPTDEDWRVAIERFKIFRDLENPDALRLAKRLPKLLEHEASAIYRIADTYERTGELDTDLSKHGAIAINDRLASRGYRREVPFDSWALGFLDELPKPVERSPAALRQRAAIIQDAAEGVQRLVDIYLECIEWLREAAGKTRGRYPSVSMYWLISTTDQWGSTIREIARRLDEGGAVPESAGTQVSRAAQWEVILKKGRSRARRRGPAEGTE